MILKKVPNQKDAEDLTIETFAKAFHKLALFQMIKAQYSTSTYWIKI
jgi:DNA-directed RNA polymerase specialized sigma24 family protein